MQPVARLLALWSALAAAARAPGPLRTADSGTASNSLGLHPVPTVVIGLLGTVRIACADGSHDLSPGSALALRPGVPHRHVPLRAGAACLDLGFDYGWCDFELRCPGTTLAATLPTEPAATLVNRMLDGDTDAYAGLLALLVERPWQDARALPEAVRRMRDRIRNHGLEPLTAAAVARASGLGQSRAWQVFRQHFGCTPHQALERRRCAVAAELLAHGRPVAAVAAQCGYRNRDTFSRAFTRVRGHPPRTARVRPGRLAQRRKSCPASSQAKRGLPTR